MTSYRLLERRSVMLPQLHGLISGNVTLEKDDVHVPYAFCYQMMFEFPSTLQSLIAKLMRLIPNCTQSL